MKAIFETRGSRQVDIHYVNTGVPNVVEENFEGFYLEHNDLSLEEVLQDQEIVYQSLQTRTADPNPDHERSGGERQVAVEEGESSQVGNDESQLALDEALARALQELENLNDDVSLSETSESETVNHEAESAVNGEVNSAGTSDLPVRQDNIDPDNMTYEELQSLVESVGNESRGLSDEVISYLPSFKYKTGLFSKKDKHEECSICLLAYKNRDLLITLPCEHQYHSKCVTPWLKENKACPVCKKEVFGS